MRHYLKKKPSKKGMVEVSSLNITKEKKRVRGR
jgi:hypothetical protein